MQTKRMFKPMRAVIGTLMILAGSGLIYWELFVHLGRIRLVGLAAAVLVGEVGGIVVLFRSLAKICSKCGTEISTTELSYPPGALTQVKSYAEHPGPIDALMSARTVVAEDRERAILALQGCNKCRCFSRVAAHRAVWRNNGGFFEVREQTSWRNTDESEASVLGQLVDGRRRMSFQ